jgi:5-methyltetrahydrofolate--homocysteine methyltransferase
MNKTVLDALREGEIVIGDGGLGTLLQASGLPAGTIPEAWNAERPDVVRAAHQAYLDAGSQIITTNTFGGNHYRLADAGLEDRLEELNRLGVELAREVVGERAWLGGSVGPTGQLLEPYGTLSLQRAEAVYARQIEILAEAGVDLILVETQHDIEEACAAIRMAKAHTDLPVSAGFAFDARGRTMMGLTPQDAARRVEEAGADIVGANCGEGPEAIARALEGMREATDLPLLAQSNAGVPKTDADGNAVWDVMPEEMAEQAERFVALGARVIGGCCGSGPNHIRAIIRKLKGQATGA